MIKEDHHFRRGLILALCVAASFFVALLVVGIYSAVFSKTDKCLHLCCNLYNGDDLMFSVDSSDAELSHDKIHFQSPLETFLADEYIDEISTIEIIEVRDVKNPQDLDVVIAAVLETRFTEEYTFKCMAVVISDVWALTKAECCTNNAVAIYIKSAEEKFRPIVTVLFSDESETELALIRYQKTKVKITPLGKINLQRSLEYFTFSIKSNLTLEEKQKAFIYENLHLETLYNLTCKTNNSENVCFVSYNKDECVTEEKLIFNDKKEFVGFQTQFDCSLDIYKIVYYIDVDSYKQWILDNIENTSKYSYLA